ncbi:CCA tRNA nucleotidyltransferase [Virgibacillus oceani]|uniref:CCA-adding enzyme n=1 Tax=Virgibacillus oceani TaxID=1479511 RepID=A0A917LZA3_9BACI|nr:CCA tRNA nucleotidyltransferase [Virgibacillus oceani]GGG65438.1 CCA-adding enzyme [Virgibacillus oceani]
MQLDRFEQAKFILEKIEKDNHQAYFVGGCVRDLLLERPIGDIDIATSATPQEIQTIFDKVIPVGIKHGTVIVRHEHQSYEITTFRVEGKYSDHRHPDSVEFIKTIDQDLKRRDFTINALAMDKDGDIIDLFMGEEDLKKKMIRTVGDGYERFTEDPLRIMRALRFSSQLGFMIEHKTYSQMQILKQQIETIAVERLNAEFTKLFAGEFVERGIAYLKSTEIYNHLPIMVKYPYIIDYLPKKLKPLSSFGQVIALFHYIEPAIGIATWVKEWRCSNKIKFEAVQLTQALRNYKANRIDRWLVYCLNAEYYRGFVKLIHIFHDNTRVSIEDLELIDKALPIKSKKDLALDGNDLLSLFPKAKRGPWLQSHLYKLEQQVVLGNVKNSKTELKEWIRCHPPEIN